MSIVHRPTGFVRLNSRMYRCWIIAAFTSCAFAQTPDVNLGPQSRRRDRLAGIPLTVSAGAWSTFGKPPLHSSGYFSLSRLA